MLSVVDETDDDWQAVTSLGSWDDFDDFFQQKSTCFGFHPEAKVGVLVYGTHASPLGGAMGGKGRKTTTRLGAFRDTINAAFHLDRQ